VNAPARSVRGAAARVALIATAIVGLAYAAVGAAVILTVSHNLTADVDARLQRSAERITSGQLVSGFGGLGSPAPPQIPGGPRFGPPLLLWVIDGSGEVVNSSDPTAPLPPAALSTTEPRTVDVNGTPVRLMGADIRGGRVVIGQTVDGVAQSRRSILVTELLIAPLLLAAVFLGAFTVGKRVGQPIERARQRQTDLTADASHELRTPLSVIQAQATLALTGEREAGWYREAFTRVDAETRRMRRLVDDLLWLARFDAATGAPTWEPADLNTLAGQAVLRFEAVATARHITIAAHPDGGDPAAVAPPEWIDRLLGVLIDNACRYTPEGGTVSVSVGGDTQRVYLRVEDSGPGIADDQRDRIFDRFHRASETPGGAGLGLAIGDAVVRATQGRWEIGRSDLGGASMAVSWPRGGGRARGRPLPDPAPVSG
jgi:signal transduction histidine kinase